MRDLIPKIRERPWFRAAFLVYVLAGVLLVTLHQHHGAQYGHDCAVCAAVHTPVTIPHSSIQLPIPTAIGFTVALGDERRKEYDPRDTTSSRAPPPGLPSS